MPRPGPGHVLEQRLFGQGQPGFCWPGLGTAAGMEPPGLPLSLLHVPA